MAKPAARVVRFTRADPAEIIDCIVNVRQARNGWINFRPFIDDHDPPATDSSHTDRPRTSKDSAHGIGGLLLKPAPSLPECTWVPGEHHRRKGPMPDSIGLHHPHGRRAGPALVEHGITHAASEEARKNFCELQATLPALPVSPVPKS